MKKIAFIIALTALLALHTIAQTNTDAVVKSVLPTFKSDGCSLFPDGKYLNCCVEHDRAYFDGGSWTLRWRADKKLFKCVAAKKGFEHKLIAPLMWTGVRVFGLPFLPTPFRWDFGRGRNSK